MRTLVGARRIRVLLAQQGRPAAGAEEDGRRQDVGDQHRRRRPHQPEDKLRTVRIGHAATRL